MASARRKSEHAQELILAAIRPDEIRGAVRDGSLQRAALGNVHEVADHGVPPIRQSEANLRSVIKTAEAIAPCVLWIDEIEKGFSGSKSSGSTDGGTSSRVFGSFLSWMQEKDQPVFVVATANDVSKLPPEFLRKGRFDEMFFVDLPDAQERAQIWDIVIKRHGRRSADFDTVALSRACEQFTGAEIAAVFIDAMHEAYAKGREPGPKDIVDAIAHTVPLAQLMDGQIGALRHWA